MAESEETTENVEEVDLPEATAEATRLRGDDHRPRRAGTRKERNAAERAAKAKPASGPRTLEERLAERAAHKERNARQRRPTAPSRRSSAPRRVRPLRWSRSSTLPSTARASPKVRQGIVVSDKADKTIIVRVDIARRHKRYHKILRSSVTLHVHDESNDAHAGDTVRVQECRPMSRTKRWRLLDVLERAR